MTIRISPPEVNEPLITEHLIAPHNDVGTAYADALDPRNSGTGRLETEHQRTLQIDYDEKTARRVAEVHAQGQKRRAALESIAPPLDRRTPLEEARDEMEALRQHVDVELPPHVEAKWLTKQLVDQFNSKRGLESPTEGSFAVEPFPASISSIIFVSGMIALETLIIGLLLGPFSPGGAKGAAGMALIGSLLFTGLASVLGIFSLRALNHPSVVIRWLARATAIACLIAAKLLAMFISAYRLQLKSDGPLTLLSAYHSPEGILFIFFSMAVFCFSAWKLTGGSTLPWTPVFGEATVTRGYWIARDALTAVKEHIRSQVEDIYNDKADKARASIDADETILANEDASLREFESSAEASARAADMDRVHFQSRLARYQSAYKTAAPHQTFADASFGPAVFSDVGRDIDKALSDAKLRVASSRHAYADHIRQLTEAQAEARANIEWKFSELEAKASASIVGQGGTSDAQI